ncbi:hypothetical protein L3X38_036990 [Prunus dulcis]|uniref:Integrase zinc-binding domain-containing protein n=1 Tax=Prunus dulcis TaxID=3755 RepID=A0AAD4V2U1_PRUDU|nr:hypothetical protein L3X38_036990 [Prunus dulcis]
MREICVYKVYFPELRFSDIVLPEDQPGYRLFEKEPKDEEARTDFRKKFLSVMLIRDLPFGYGKPPNYHLGGDIYHPNFRNPYLAFFINGTLPTNSKHARKLKRIVKRYFIDGSTLYRKGFKGEPLKCLGVSEAQQVMQEIHAEECGEHQGMKRLHRQLLSVGYHWPTIKNGAYNFLKKCHTCQVHANLSHKPPTLLQDMRTP